MLAQWVYVFLGGWVNGWVTERDGGVWKKQLI